MFRAGRLLFQFENNDPCGFLLLGPPKKTWRIYQTCVQPDARRIEHATTLIDTIKRRAHAANVHQIELWCAADLEANQFWQAVGFQPTTTRHKRKEKNRLQQGYRLELPAGTRHRETLSRNYKWQTERKLLSLFATFHGNDHAIQKRIRAREE